MRCTYSDVQFDSNANIGKWKVEDEGGDYLRKRKNAVIAAAMAMTRKREKAAKHLVAHFLSVLLNNWISSSLSASVLVGSQFSGAWSGEMRMKVPASQNKGNRKPNLKRYMASVGGSATEAYDGRSVESA